MCCRWARHRPFIDVNRDESGTYGTARTPVPVSSAPGLVFSQGVAAIAGRDRRAAMGSPAVVYELCDDSSEAIAM